MIGLFHNIARQLAGIQWNIELGGILSHTLYLYELWNIANYTTFQNYDASTDLLRSVSVTDPVAIWKHVVFACLNISRTPVNGIQLQFRLCFGEDAMNQTQRWLKHFT